MRFWPRRKVYIDNLPKTHDLRFGVIFVVGLALVFGALYGVGYAVAGNKLPHGTTVAKVDVGGMSPDQARTVLQGRLAPRLERPLKVTAARQEFSIDPQRAGLTFDIDATLADALGGSPWDPRHMMHVLMGGDELQPIVDVDNHDLAAHLKKIADHVERKPEDSTVSFTTGRAKVTYGRAGRALDYQRSGDRLIAALVAGEEHARLATQAVQPHVTGIKATRFAESVGRKAVHGPIRIKVADSAVTLRPHQFARTLRAARGHGGLRLDINRAKLAKRARPTLARLPHHPVNARIRFAGDRPVVVPGTSGVRVTRANLAAAVLKAVRHGGSRRVARADVVPDDPKVTTQEVRMMQVKERVSALSTRFTVGDRQPDPSHALHQLDGALIRPDGTFSFLGRVGDSGSPAVSFVASMAYDAAFFAGLDIPEHTSSPIYSHTFSPGRDAHVEAPAVDLVLHNSTPYGVYIRAYTEKSGGKKSRARVAHLEMWSTSYWTVRARTSNRYDVTKPRVFTNTKKSCIPRDGVPGFGVDVTRVLKRHGHKRTDHTHTSYAPLDEVRCGKD